MPDRDTDEKRGDGGKKLHDEPNLSSCGAVDTGPVWMVAASHTGRRILGREDQRAVRPLMFPPGGRTKLYRVVSLWTPAPAIVPRQPIVSAADTDQYLYRSS